MWRCAVIYILKSYPKKWIFHWANRTKRCTEINLVNIETFAFAYFYVLSTNFLSKYIEMLIKMCLELTVTSLNFLKIFTISFWDFRPNSNCWPSLESEWQSSQLSRTEFLPAHEYYGLDGLNFFLDHLFPQSFLHIWGDCTVDSNFNWHYCHFHTLSLFLFSSKVQVFVNIFLFFFFFTFLYFHSFDFLGMMMFAIRQVSFLLFIN